MRADMHSLGERLGHGGPALRTALRGFELACIRQVQPRASFRRFVREHLMRHTEGCREDFPVEPGLLPHAPARCFHRSPRTAAHVLWGQFFCSDHRARLNELRGFLMHKLSTQVGNPLMQASRLPGDALVAQRAFTSTHRGPKNMRENPKPSARPNRPLDPLLASCSRTEEATPPCA